MTKPKKKIGIRDQVIQCTDDLLYKKGFNRMSFSDIAESANVPRGNINYHFKTKEDVLEAVIEYRITGMQHMLDHWDRILESPLQRLKRYAQIPINESDRIIEYGCPMGTLNSELGKTQESLQALAKQQMDVFKDWLQEQFKQYCPELNAKHQTEHLLVRTQGISVLSHIYKDQEIIRREVRSIEQWLENLVDS